MSSGQAEPTGMSDNTAQLADRIEAQLRMVGSPVRAEHEKAYLKSRLVFLGASVPSVRAAAKATHRANPGLSRPELHALAEELWARGIHECRMAAVEILDAYGGLLGIADLPLLERFLRESGTWALVDGLAVSVVGRLVDQPADAASTLDRWAEDDDFWLRRSALLALLPGLRSGAGDFERFARYADRMLDEREFFIRKAIGWVLRETGRRRPELVTQWLAPRTARASGVTMREAVKYLPDTERDSLMQAYREGRPHRQYPDQTPRRAR